MPTPSQKLRVRTREALIEPGQGSQNRFTRIRHALNSLLWHELLQSIFTEASHRVEQAFRAHGLPEFGVNTIRETLKTPQAVRSILPLVHLAIHIVNS